MSLSGDVTRVWKLVSSIRKVACNMPLNPQTKHTSRGCRVLLINSTAEEGGRLVMPGSGL